MIFLKKQQQIKKNTVFKNIRINTIRVTISKPLSNQKTKIVVKILK